MKRRTGSTKPMTGITTAEWIKAHGNKYKTCDFTIADTEGNIILDDRIAYLEARSDEYNKNWKAKCRGKKVVEVKTMNKGICLVVA